jgi:hypothetical protein
VNIRRHIAIVAVLCGIGVSIPAQAVPVLGIRLQESGFSDLTVTSTTNPLVVNQAYGTFSTNVEVNNVVLNPLSIDLGSTNVSTATAGTLTITGSVQNLVSPVGALEFLSQFSGNFTGGVGSVHLATYLDNTNTLFGTGTLLSTLGSTASPFSLSELRPGTSAAPFALTEVLTITTTGAAVLSLDGSILTLPEPGSLALFAGVLGGLVLTGRSKRK